MRHGGHHIPIQSERRQPPQDSLDLERFLPYRLSVLSNTISAAIARIYDQRFQLSMTEWRVMAVVGNKPGLSARQVADRTAMDKVAVSRAVERLVQSGRLERGTNDEDRRSTVLRLSEQGQQVYREVVPAAREIEQQLLARLTPEERESLRQLVARLGAAARQL